LPLAVFKEVFDCGKSEPVVQKSYTFKEGWRVGYGEKEKALLDSGIPLQSGSSVKVFAMEDDIVKFGQGDFGFLKRTLDFCWETFIYVLYLQ